MARKSMKFGSSSSSSSVTEFATRISRALITASTPTRSWSPSLEHTLHRLGCRDSLTPSLVARVIDPFLMSHHSLALGFFNWASQQPGFSHTSVSYQSILNSLSSSRHFNAIDALLREVRAQRVSLDASVYGSVISSLLARGKCLSAFFVLREVSSLIEDIGPEICNSLLAALASNGHLEHARKVIDEMSQRGVLLTTLGFGVFVWRLCESVELAVVMGLLDEVKGSDSEVNGSIIALLVVHGLCRASRFSEAFLILDELRTRNCKPDFIAYRVVSEAFRSERNVVETEKVLKKKRKLGVAPRSNDYEHFISLLVSERLLLEAKELGQVIISGNFPIEPDTLNVLIGSISAVDPDSAIKFLDFMISKERYPNLSTLSNLSDNLCKHDKVAQLLGIFDLLSSRNYFRDSESFGVMISYLCRAGKLREAYGVLHEMKRKSVGPDISSYNCLMEACCREDLLRPAKRLWDEMYVNGFSGDLKTYNILIRKLSEVGQIEEAQRLLRNMFDKQVMPDGTTYTSLLRGLCREEKFEDAFEILNKAAKQDLMLGRNLLSTYISDLCKKGHFLAASEMLWKVDNGVASSNSHVILLKCLANSSQVPIGIKHITHLRETLPSILQIVSDKLSASLSSSSKPETILQLIQSMNQ